MHTVTVHYMHLPNLDFIFSHECVDINVLVNASCSIQVGCPYSFLCSWHESGSRIIICFTLCHIFSGNLSGSQVQEVMSSLIAEYIRVKKSLIQFFVYVHANSSVWLHVPGSQ